MGVQEVRLENSDFVVIFCSVTHDEPFLLPFSDLNLNDECHISQFVTSDVELDDAADGNKFGK